jgi:peptide/nickel transport system substrate-binding protein
MKRTLLLALLFALMAAACQPAAVNPPPTVDDPGPILQPAAIPEPTPMEQPPVVLTICTASLPETRFPYASPATPAKSRLVDLLYPPAYTLENLRLEAVPIRRGQMVIDARGQLVMAAEGIWVRPASCRESACALTWNGLDPLAMDQMVMDYRLRPGLTWGDGTPLSATDAVFGFHLVSGPFSAAFGWAEAHTESFDAVDTSRLTGRGYPGFASSQPEQFYWLPLPAHRFADAADAVTLAADPFWREDGSGYGPFKFAGQEDALLRLERNPAYPYPDDAYPGVDQVVLRRIAGGAPAAWEALQNGTCDALDASFNLAEDPALLNAIAAEAGYTVLRTPGGAPTQLVFGIRPAEYDTLNNPVFARRKDFFADPRTRQALALCVDVENLAAQTGAAPARPDGLAYDPAAGRALLEEVGWADHDGDPLTPRQALNVTGVFNATPLALTLLVGPSPFHQDLAAGIAEGLQACGVGVDLETLPTDELYAPGPEGPVFGRNFDLALIAWQPAPGPLCALYTSWAVPNTGNGWVGTNVAGFADAEFDALCSAALLAIPEEAPARQLAVDAAFLEWLPALPLVEPVDVEVWRGDSW